MEAQARSRRLGGAAEILVMRADTPSAAWRAADAMAQQRALQAHLLRRLGPPERAHDDAAERQRLEPVWRDWMAREAARCDRASHPRTATEFIGWYRELFRDTVTRSAGFFDHLAEAASLQALARYVAMEALVDGRFDDVIALAQIGLDDHAKLALAHNYWDEMGQGRREAMHTVLFEHSARWFRAMLPQESAPQPGEAALRNGNMLMLFALERSYALRLLGAITLLEHTAPHRFASVVRGMRRVGVPQEVVHYHELHIRIDARHGDDLLHDVLLPLVARAPHAIPELALGMQIRAVIAADYYDALRHEMDIAPESLSIAGPLRRPQAPAAPPRVASKDTP